MIGSIITGLIGWGRDWSGRQQELKAIDHKAEIVRRKARAEAAGKMDQHSLSNITWEDGYLILLFTLPLLGLFLSPILAIVWPEWSQVTEAIKAAFLAMKETPPAYQGAVGLIFVYVFGFRRLLHRVLDNWSGWRRSEK